MNLELRWKQSIGLDEHSERVKLSEEKVDHDSLSTRSILPTMKIHPFLCFLVGMGMWLVEGSPVSPL